MKKTTATAMTIRPVPPIVAPMNMPLGSVSLLMSVDVVDGDGVVLAVSEGGVCVVDGSGGGIVLIDELVEVSGA
jgi:hypothetical protein